MNLVKKLSEAFALPDLRVGARIKQLNFSKLYFTQTVLLLYSCTLPKLLNCTATVQMYFT